MSFDHIRVADILAIHTDQIARYGGAYGVRDSGLLGLRCFVLKPAVTSR
jgi:death-on-curing protein